MRYHLASLVLALGAVSFAQASVNIVSADFLAIADAQAGSIALTDIALGSDVTSSGSYSASVYVDEISPAGQSAYAQSFASAQWSQVSPTSIVGSTYGSAWANDLGLGTSAKASARLVLYFDVAQESTGTFDFEGKSSIVQRRVGGTWELVADADWTGSLSAARYRWFTNENYEITGSGSHDGFAEFSADIEAVPEPATLLALSVGAALAARRRKRG